MVRHRYISIFDLAVNTNLLNELVLRSAGA